MIRPLAAAMLLGVATLPAVAQDRPPMMPTKDVVVDYKVLGVAPEQTMRMSWSGPLMRVDTPGGHGYMIVDRNKQVGMMVMPAQRAYMEMDTSAMASPGAMPDEKGRYARGGAATVVGMTCTIWNYEGPKGSGTACITADGVMLRAIAMDGTGLEATKVTLAPVPTSQFHPPEGFQKMDMGAMGGAMARPPGPRQ